MGKFDIQGIINALEAPMHDDHELVRKTTELFVPPFQKVIDVYASTIEGTTTESGSFAKKFMVTRSINDLLAGFHLMRQGYIAQAYSTLRPILEASDLFDVFGVDANLAKIWATGDWKAKQAISPRAVRKRLGLPTYDEIYSHFCESGSHPAFESTRSMTAQKADTNESDRPQVTMWIGGIIFEHAFVFQACFCFILLHLIWQKVHQLSKDSADPKLSIEVSQAVLDSLMAFTDYKKEYFGTGTQYGDTMVAMQQELKSLLSDAAKEV